MKQIGILGGGQLGRMLQQAAIPLQIHGHVLDPSADAPCRIFSDFTVGNVKSEKEVFEWGKAFDAITVEWEHVSADGLALLEAEGMAVAPSAAALRTVQDKGLQKKFFTDNSIPTAAYTLCENAVDIMAQWNGLCVQKSRTGGYDGKGVQVLRHASEAWDVPSVIEDLVAIEKEISVIVVRGWNGEMVTYDPVEMVFDPVGNLVDTVQAPATITPSQQHEAIDIARTVAEKLNIVGLLAVELFVTKQGEIMVNEVAPRPHNSGHHTIEGCATSQYENHLRAALGLPLGATTLRAAVVMGNLLGTGEAGPTQVLGLEKALSQEETHVHLYGKTTCKPMRKMGHVTCLAETIEEAHARLSYAKNHIQITGKTA